MRASKNIIYIVEGKTDGKITQAIKNKYIVSGKVNVINLLQNKIKNTFLRLIKSKTIVIVVFDTDVEGESKISMLQDNIETLKKHSNVEQVILIPQVNNLEDELIYSTEVRHIKDLINCKSNTDFKRELLKKKEKNLLIQLEKQGFNLEKFWSRQANNSYKIFNNDGYKIKNKL